MNLLNQKIIESIIIIDICWHLHTQLFVVFVVHFILHSVQCTHFFKSVKLIEPNLDNSHTPFRNFLHTITLTCSFFFSSFVGKQNQFFYHVRHSVRIWLLANSVRFDVFSKQEKKCFLCMRGVEKKNDGTGQISTVTNIQRLRS